MRFKNWASLLWLLHVTVGSSYLTSFANTRFSRTMRTDGVTETQVAGAEKSDDATILTLEVCNV